MAILGSIEVRIARNTSGKAKADDAGNPLSEYQKPNSSVNQPSNPVEKYIEATTDQPFQIEVYIKPGFKLYNADGIKIGIEIDDKTVAFSSYHCAKTVIQHMREGKPLVTSYVPRVEENRHFRMGFTFGSLDLDEKLDVSQDQADSQAEKLGRIIVNVDRATLGKEKVRGVWNYYKCTASVNVPKDVYKDRHIRHSLMAGLEVENEAPSPTTFEHIRYRKHGCHKLVFIFRYRDHLALQVLGCIPQDTLQASHIEAPTAIQNDWDDPVVGEKDSANVEVVKLRAEIERLRAFEREATELKHTIEGLKQENASMKAIKDQIAALTGNLGKTSSNPMPSTAGIKSEVKRERIEKEHIEGRSSPTSGPKERRAKRPRSFVEID